MNSYMVAWSDFSDVITPLTDALPITNLIGILAGILGVTVAFTLVWRFTAYIKNSIIGGMTNSKGRRRGK